MNIIKPRKRMQKKIKSIASVLVVFALTISTVVAPFSTAVATTTAVSITEETQSGESSVSSVNVNETVVNVTAEQESHTESYTETNVSESVFSTCKLTSNVNVVNAGGSVILSWDTVGFDTITLNGETFSDAKGSKTFNNIQESTTYLLVATTDDGSQNCTAKVTIKCDKPVPTPVLSCKEAGFDFEVAKFVWPVGGPWTVSQIAPGYSISLSGNQHAFSWTAGPAVSGVLVIANNSVASQEFPGGLSGSISKADVGDGTNVIEKALFCGDQIEEPTECVLQLEKSASKEHAKSSDELTYTISIKNTGDASCTGGVKIEDKLSERLTFLSYSVSDNITPGYGESPVYSADTRTLQFNGGTFTPNETGTITIKTKVKEVASCENITITNQAKASAKELDNFETGVDSNLVRTIIDGTCPPDEVIECSDFGLTTVAKWVWNVESGAFKKNTEAAGYTTSVTGPQTRVEWTATPAIEKTIASVLMTDGFMQAFPGGIAGVINASDLTNGSKTIDIVTMCAEPTEPHAPSCDLFTATPSTISRGGSAILEWRTQNGSRVVINNGIGEVTATGTTSVSPLTTTTYLLSVFGSEGQVDDTCEVPVTVVTNSVPMCENFTATPNKVAASGGTTTLAWSITGGSNINITPTIGSVTATGTRDVFVSSATTYLLTATDSDGDEVTCQAPVTRDQQTVFSCANNVVFSASDTSIDRGDSATLTWSTTDVDTVAISGINASSLSGSQSVSPRTDTSYVLTATKDGSSVECPVAIDVDSGGGGGGGGSASPRCELTISDTKIKAGEEITLRWDTSRATEISITDNRGNEVFTTEDLLNRDKADFYDGSIDLKPTRDTKYTLVAERGSRDDECEVSVDVEDSVVVVQTRDQQPLVAGISLSQVPYTGFEAGPVLTLFFYTVLVAWAFYISYLLVIRRREMPTLEQAAVIGNRLTMQQAETVRPDIFPAVSVPEKVSSLPTNLPTGAPTIGYANVATDAMSAHPHHATDAEVTELENRAHSQKALLSSDAVRHFIATTEGVVERNEALDQVIAEAKKRYPLEDGWVVVNEARMQNLCAVCQVNARQPQATPYVPTTIPDGSGSLAEAIVTGNLVAAYEMIGRRPMFALADAAADLDSLYRVRRGGTDKISDLLREHTKNLSDEQIKDMIKALTGALDGTYTDEPSAVKMAIMKAVKVLK
ncbi:MAG: hypothetical protein AAB388_04855 [Patescibacteria group bacterium]